MDRDAHWTVKYTKAEPAEDRLLPLAHLGIPAFGYEKPLILDWAYGLIRKWTAPRATAQYGAHLEDVPNCSNTASEVWADTA